MARGTIFILKLTSSQPTSTTISIPIEQRPPIEACLTRGAIHPPSLNAQGEKEQAVVMITPAGLEGIYNPSFDVTPAELITAIVTEKGVAVKNVGAADFDLSGIV